jgi:hypothetical protein
MNKETTLFIFYYDVQLRFLICIVVWIWRLTQCSELKMVKMEAILAYVKVLFQNLCG